MQPFPSTVQQFFNKSTGKIADALLKYLTQFTISPPAFMDITLTGSPFEYQAKEPGHIHIDGATTAIALIRGTETLDVSGVIIIPVAVDDIIEITYGVLPTVTFIPSYGYSTTSQ